MKRLLFFVLLLIPFISKASHVAGVDLYYTHISGNTYRISMTIYGNCNDVNHSYNNLLTKNPEILIVDSVTKVAFKSILLKLVPDSTRDVSPYCTKYLDSTNCINTSSTYQGYTRFVYSDTVTLPSKSSKWIFRFTSAMPTCGSGLGRPNLDNIVGGFLSDVVLDAMLNNASGDNSSPFFNSKIFTAYCVNVPSSYYQLANDPDNDSLYYQLVTPLKASSNCIGPPITMTYVSGFNPLMTSPNAFSFNGNNGTMIFTANAVQVSAVDTKVYEYRNGVLVGYTMREKIFKILGNCNNTPPTAAIDTTIQSLQGAMWYHDSVIACSGNVVHFNIPVSSPTGDTLIASVTNIPSGSNIIISNNNTKTPTINFTWNTSGVPPGSYTFYGDYQDNGCPLKSENLVTYTIIITDGGSVNASIVYPTFCLHKAAVQYDVQSPFYPYTLTVSQGSTVVKSLTGNTASIVADSLAAGTYTIKLSSPGVPCTHQLTFTVSDSGLYAYSPTALSPIDYCRNADAVPLIATADTGSLQGTVFRWYDQNMNFISNSAPIPPTNAAGTFTYYVREQYKTCESITDTVVVNVSTTDCNYDITIHNAITPNGDGKNDKWVIDNLGYYPNMNVQVFDKLGDKVYEQTNYQNDWDGGNLPSGVYYYLIRLNGVNKTSGTTKFTGFLMIKR